MPESNCLVMVITTVASSAEADSLATSLIDESLAACVQREGPIASCYRWAGKVERAEEFRLVIKSSMVSWPILKARLAQLHPYDEPEIIMLPVADATDGYRDWVIDQTRVGR